MCARQAGKYEQLFCWHVEKVSDFGHCPRSWLIILILNPDKFCKVYIQLLRKLLPSKFMLASGELEQIHEHRARRGCPQRLLFEIFHCRHEATDRNEAIVLQGCLFL